MLHYIPRFYLGFCHKGSFPKVPRIQIRDRKAGFWDSSEALSQLQHRSDHFCTHGTHTSIEKLCHCCMSTAVAILLSLHEPTAIPAAPVRLQCERTLRQGTTSEVQRRTTQLKAMKFTVSKLLRSYTCNSTVCKVGGLPNHSALSGLLRIGGLCSGRGWMTARTYSVPVSRVPSCGVLGFLGTSQRDFAKKPLKLPTKERLPNGSSRN